MSNTAPRQRSRNGCKECRRRHRRCDESKPACSYCKETGIVCDYSKNLSWGGRPFHKSRFGKYLKTQSTVSKAPSEPMLADVAERDSKDQFVYVPRPSTQPERCSPPIPDRIAEPVETTSEHVESTLQDNTLSNHGCFYFNTDVERCYSEGTTLQDKKEFEMTQLVGLRSTILTSPSEYAHLSARHRILTDYFCSKVSASISCHVGIKDDICSSIIPMALQSPPIMAGLLYAAASHRLSARVEQSSGEVAALRSGAIRLLREEIQRPETQSDLTIPLAASLVLCIAETVSCEDSGGGWLVYLAGASELLKRRNQSRSSLEWPSDIFMRLYNSLELTMVTFRLPSSSHLTQWELTEGNDYIDDFRGYSTALVPIFRQLQSLERSSYDERSSPVTTPSRSLQQLIERVRAMLALRTARFRPEVAASLSLDAQTDLWLLDEAYHHMALLQMHHSVECNKEDLIAETDTSIERIIACISSMGMAARPCPGVASLAPLFVAGYHSVEDTQRERITVLLCVIEECFGMGNVRLTRQFLESHWENPGSRHSLADCGLEFLPH